MKEILKIKKGWFIAAYVIGLIFYITDMVFTYQSAQKAAEANIWIFIYSHTMFLGALVFCAKSGTRRKFLWRTFAGFVFLLSIFVMMTPPILSVVAAYALFLSIGYIHIRTIKTTDIFGERELPTEMDGAKEPTSQQYKMSIWILASLMILFVSCWSL